MEIELAKHQGSIVVRSTEIAAHFGKRHDNVMQDIERLLRGFVEQPNICRSAFFFESKFTNDRNREYREYLMSRDGFALLAMGFTGAKALQWKLKYIDAFNQMEKAAITTQIGAMDHYGEVLAIMESDKEKASIHGKALAEWRKARKQHIEDVSIAHSKAQLLLNFKA
jgi:Rha family phage regulatory protein